MFVIPILDMTTNCFINVIICHICVNASYNSRMGDDILARVKVETVTHSYRVESSNMLEDYQKLDSSYE